MRRLRFGSGARRAAAATLRFCLRLVDEQLAMNAVTARQFFCYLDNDEDAYG